MPILSSPDAPGNVALNSGHFTVTPECLITVQPGNGVEDFGVAPLDLSDRLLSIDVQFSADNPAGTANVKMALGKGADSLSPLISTSPQLSNGQKVLAPRHHIQLSFYVAGQPYNVLSGRIMNVNVAESLGVVGLQAQDWGAYLQETAIRETKIYGLEGGKLAELVMGDILNDNAWSQFQVDTPETSGFMIYPYPAGETTVLEALRTIAQQIGWDVRWFPNGWRNRPGGPLVHFYNPAFSTEFDIHGNRFVVATDATLDKRRYSSIQELSWSDQDVRNDWDVYYQDPTTGLPIGPVHAESAESIAQYGRRKARIYLQRAENIRDNDHALYYARAALADNQDPFASHKIRGPLYPNVTLNDVHLYKANDLEYDQDLTLAVVGYQHHWEVTRGSQPWTVIAGRGKPLGAYRDYRKSRAPKTIVSTVPPTEANWAPEGTVIYVAAAA